MVVIIKLDSATQGQRFSGKVSELRIALCTILIVLSISIFCISAHAWILGGTAVCTAVNGQGNPWIIEDDIGGTIIVWVDYRNGNADVYAQRLDASGNSLWTTDGVAICTATGNQEVARHTTDGSGGAIIVWHDTRVGQFDVYAQRIDASGTVQWTVNGVAICTATGEQTQPRPVSDGSGGAIICWNDKRGGADADTYAQRVNSLGMVQWAADGIPVCDATGSQFYARLISDNSGGAIMAWQDGRSGLNIYAQRINGSGSKVWSTYPFGVPICTSSGNQKRPELATDGSGGAIITWYDERGSDYNIYARKILANGSIQWTTGGVVLCSASGDQEKPKIIPDGGGGAIVAWYDERGSDRDIYVQKVDGSGGVQWAADGEPICTATGDQDGQSLVTDGAGEAIIVWVDRRSGDCDVYAQLIDASGSMQWNTDGDEIAGGTSQQVSAKLVSDGAGGAIITWNDDDIWASRKYKSGQANVSNIPLPFKLSQNFPNPFNPATVITFNVIKPSHIALKIYNFSGELIKTLCRGYYYTGVYEVNWDGKNNMKESVASGIYLYQLSTSNHKMTKKMLLIK